MFYIFVLERLGCVYYVVVVSVIFVEYLECLGIGGVGEFVFFFEVALEVVFFLGVFFGV